MARARSRSRSEASDTRHVTAAVLGRVVSDALGAKGREVVRIEALPIAGAQIATLMFDGVRSPWRQVCGWRRTVLSGSARRSPSQFAISSATAPPVVDIACEATDGLLRLYNVWDSAADESANRTALVLGWWLRSWTTTGVVTYATTLDSIPTSANSCSRCRSPSDLPIERGPGAPSPTPRTSPHEDSREPVRARGYVAERHAAPSQFTRLVQMPRPPRTRTAGAPAPTTARVRTDRIWGDAICALFDQCAGLSAARRSRRHARVGGGVAAAAT